MKNNLISYVFTGLQLGFIYAKIAGLINWNWHLVLLPFYIIVGIFFLCTAMVETTGQSEKK